MNGIIMDSALNASNPMGSQTNMLTGERSGPVENNNFIIRQARLDDIAQICDWRTKELGYTSHTKFFQTIFTHYSDGWFVAEGPDGSIIGSILGINFDGTTAFGSFYAVRSSYRCKGIGSKLWDIRLQYIGPRNLAMNAADTRIDANTKAGLKLAFKLTAYSGKMRTNILGKVRREAESMGSASKIIHLGTYPNREQLIAPLIAYDTFIHTIPRSKFIEALIRDTSEILTCVALKSNDDLDPKSIKRTISGYGMLRPLCHGYIVGPLYADSPETGRALLFNLVANLKEADKELIILVVNEDLQDSCISDSAQANGERREMVGILMEELDLAYEFEVYRMYSQNKMAPKLPLSKVYALTCIECFLT